MEMNQNPSPAGLKEAVRKLGWLALGQMLQHVPVRNWPALPADLFAIKVPANVPARSVDAPDGGANVNIVLGLFDRVRDLPGDLAECGVFQGSTFIPLALHLAQQRLDKRLFGFDSFAGFDASVATDIAMGGAADTEKRQGGFSQTSLGFVQRRLTALGLGARTQLFQGYFETTIERAPATRYCFVHLDCDLYSSYKTCLQYFYPRMVPGGVILLDEYNDPPWPGCNQAVDEFLPGRPEALQMIASDGYQKYYLVKQ